MELKQKFGKFHDFRSNHRRKYERTCRDWARGECKNEACPYWHYRVADKDRLKKNQICKEYLAGCCKFGDECIYAHTNIIPADDNDAAYLKACARHCTGPVGRIRQCPAESTFPVAPGGWGGQAGGSGRHPPQLWRQAWVSSGFREWGTNGVGP